MNQLDSMGIGRHPIGAVHAFLAVPPEPFARTRFDNGHACGAL